jgi:proteic killer suppression protein
MIKSFRHKGLAELFADGKTARIDRKMHARISEPLDALDAARRPQDMNLPGYKFHALHGVPPRYTVHVNAPWCITFEFDGENAMRVDLEQYH